MKKFLLTVGGFIGLFLLYKIGLIALLYSVSPAESKKLDFYGVNDKTKPKIILVGASNILYNYDIRYLNKVFPEYNVIGCHYTASSGLYVTLDKLSYLQPSKNDIIVFDFPHSYYESANYIPVNELKTIRLMTKKILVGSFLHNPLYATKSFLRLNPKDFLHVFKEHGQRKERKDTIHFRYTYPIRKPRYLTCWTSDENKFTVSSSGFEKEYVQSLANVLHAQFPSRILFRFPALRKNDFAIDTARVHYLEKEYPFLNTFTSSLYDTPLMFDQWYHLNQCGQRLNTPDLEKELKKHLAFTP